MIYIHFSYIYLKHLQNINILVEFSEVMGYRVKYQTLGQQAHFFDMFDGILCFSVYIVEIKEKKRFPNEEKNKKNSYIL